MEFGIGIATSAYSEMNGFFLRDVPGVANPDELVLLKSPVSYPDYRRYRERGDGSKVRFCKHCNEEIS